MLTFIKAQASSLVASGADFIITIIGVKFFGWWYLVASIVGTISGGVINFIINRNIVFRAKDQRILYQAIKYLLVWTGNLIIVTVGVYILTHFFNLNYMLSKIIVSLLTGISYNYIMQKQFIFIS